MLMVHQLTCMDVLESAKKLVQEELVMLWSEVIICFDHMI
jgi:hypothetical protein